ncbi:MAG TPA: YceI family protein [Pyrinomonadaceae bacterium]|jgi:polyisoprenoid-binding protein YceI|nr:YceI family protein [Pyrinomonadaceae bacterium]
MKRVLLFAMLALGVALVFSMFTTAKTPSLTERFAAAKPDATGPSGTYDFDKAHTFIGFKVRHMGLIEVPGFFRDFTGAVTYDAADVSKSSVTFTAKATSVDTGIAPRDNHLRTADFFDVATYPDITFTSTRIEKKGNVWMVTGDFKMKDVTKSITFPFDILGFVKGQNGSTRMGIAAETMVNRQEYNVKYNSKLPDGTSSVDDNIKVVLQIEANLPGPPKAAASPSPSE